MRCAQFWKGDPSQIQYQHSVQSEHRKPPYARGAVFGELSFLPVSPTITHPQTAISSISRPPTLVFPQFIPITVLFKHRMIIPFQTSLRLLPTSLYSVSAAHVPLPIPVSNFTRTSIAGFSVATDFSFLLHTSASSHFTVQLFAAF